MIEQELIFSACFDCCPQCEKGKNKIFTNKCPFKIIHLFQSESLITLSIIRFPSDMPNAISHAGL